MLVLYLCIYIHNSLNINSSQSKSCNKWKIDNYEDVFYNTAVIYNYMYRHGIRNMRDYIGITFANTVHVLFVI